MKKIQLYLKAAFFHMKRNSSFSLFSIIGTALTFLFVNVILQVVYAQIADTPPNVNTGRIISLSSLNDEEGKPLLFAEAEAQSIVSEIKETDAVLLSNDLTHNVLINEKRHFLLCSYTNSGMWDIKQFTLLDGRFFTEEECENKTPVVLVREGVVTNFFVGSAIGQTLTIGKKECKVIGVIKDYPFQLGPGGIPPALWLPYTLTNKVEWKVDLLFSQTKEIETAKQLVARSLNYSAQKKGEKGTFTADHISTVKEMKDKSMKTVLVVFSSAIIFLLLLIPAINMFTLNLASASNRASEIAIQRAFGATRASAFIQVIIENMLTTTLGAIIGICLSYPFVSGVERYLIPPAIEGVSLTVGVNLSVLLLGVFPLILLLSFISGGLPAYIIAKQSIAKTLKGGSRW